MPSLINTYAFVLWFLPALFFSKIIIYFIKNNTKNLFLQAVIVTILFYSSFYINLPFGIDNAMNALLFIYIGNIFFNIYRDNKVLYILPFIFIGIYSIYGIPTLDMASKTYENPVVNVIFSISAVYMLIMFFNKKINFNSRILKVWGGNTMLLFIAHPYTNNIGHLVVEKLQFREWYFNFFISLILLHTILLVKLKYNTRGVFKFICSP